MSDDAAARFFDAIAGRYERAYALPADVSRRRMTRVLRELPPSPARVLDLGVGTGRELTALLDGGYSPTGVDVSPAMLERCARRARPVPLVQADFWGPLPFDDASYDAALALHGTLAHPPDEGALAKLALELARVVRPGGVLVAEAPSPGWLERLASLTDEGDRSVRRTGSDTCRYEDTVTGASIEARVLSAERWIGALGGAWRARVEPLDEVEWLVVAQRAR
ncbi:MAG TPA: class I SAM-dependent methyltransferase [Polyangiaceae bacterium]|jgi:SAM-dependent methyltransferase